LSGIVILCKETGWKPEYVVWEMPCAWLFLILDYWPVYENKDTDTDEAQGIDEKSNKQKDISEIDSDLLADFGLKYNHA